MPRPRPPNSTPGAGPTPRPATDKRRLSASGSQAPPSPAPPRARPALPARVLTGALLDVAALLEGMAAQLAVEVVLPELGKPDVAPVVVQRATGEVAVEAWQGTGTSGPHWPPSHQPLPFPPPPG